MAELYAYVGRQAIFDRSLKVVGYELLYRDSAENRAKFSDATVAAATTMMNAFVELGLDSLVGDVRANLNMTEEFLLQRTPIPLPPERVVLEVLEDIPVTPELIASLRQLRGQGFGVALDDFVLTEQTAPLVELADSIKLDILNVDRDTIARRYAELRPLTPTLVAEKVSTPDELDYLMGLGFDQFQGFFLEVPKVIKGRRMPQDRARLMQVLAKLQAPNIDLRAIEQLLSADVGMVVRLLKLASSAALSRGAPIATLGQALARLGTQQVTALVVLIMASQFDDKPLELARQALVRAKMCEELARRQGLPSDQLFTAGLLSLVDAMLDQPIAEVVRQLPVTPLIRDALIKRDSTSGKIVDAARAQDRGDLGGLMTTGMSTDTVVGAWLAAIRWADGIVKQL
jgi:c-di-GMP phosphodiesterase